ncbi:MAG: hypothetical protein ND807_12540 [Vicinamibacterales bacterium]|nr:hypothetical protein [Vicinamibacterales bacterium]
MRSLPHAVALAAAIGLAAVGVIYGTYAAGGSDSSCYALLAGSFASGRLQPSSALVGEVPWPDAQKTFTPGGFAPSSTDPSAFAPVCAPGFSVLLAPVVKAGGPNALFYVTPLAGALLVWLTFLAGSALADSLAGAMAAVLVATSPVVLFQVVQPMNDVTTTALWMAVFVGLISGRFRLAGAACGIALLVRPNLLPLAAVAGLFVLRVDRRKVVPFALAALPCALAVLWLNANLYGSPFRSGYGSLGRLFGLAALPVNVVQYSRWLIETETVFLLLACAAPLVVDSPRRVSVWLAFGLATATCSVYFLYTPFDDWSYLRFLMPAITLLLVLASAATVAVARRVIEKGSGAFFQRLAVPGAVGLVAIGLGVMGVRTASERFAFAMHALEQRYRSAGVVVRDALPSDAVVLSVWDSGAVRFHGRKEALVWEGLDPAWLDRSLEWLRAHGRRPYILVESWEEPGFRSRFGDQSDVGKLDWPPKYEVDRVVRIYDPEDREPYHRGGRVNTEYRWPMLRK